MKIQYFGHACFALRLESGATIVTDPFDPSVTFPPCNIECSIALVSHEHFDHNYTDGLRGNFETVRSPGEYSFGDVRITGVESCHDGEGGNLRGKNNIYIIEAEGLRIAHLGDLGHMPDKAQLAALENLDVLMLPIGGTYTIDTPQAEELIRSVKPRMAIAMHFRTPEYEIRITTEEAFAAGMHAARLPREIEITKENIGSMPAAVVMDYK